MLACSRRFAPGRSGPACCSAGYRPPYARSCRRALAVADVGDVGTGLVVIDVELGPDIRSGEVVELLEGCAHALGTAVAREPRGEGLAGFALFVEAPHDAHDGFRRALGRYLQRL